MTGDNDEAKEIFLDSSVVARSIFLASLLLASHVKTAWHQTNETRCHNSIAKA